jgi:protein tyrosine phosphatase
MQGEELPGDSIHTIVQLTQDMELGRRKADPYFPSEVGKTWTIPPEPECPLADIEVTTLSKKRIEEFDCIETTLQLRFMGQERAATVRHLLYTGWPDFGVPEEPQKLCGLLRYVDNLMESKEGPVMVGCSAGIGRTGTFIAAASLMRSKLTSEPRESPLGPISEEWSDDQVVREIDSLREQRGGMVQREEQMELIYQLLEQAYT